VFLEDESTTVGSQDSRPDAVARVLYLGRGSSGFVPHLRDTQLTALI